MIFVFYFFAAVLVFFSFRSLLGGIAYLKYFRAELAKPTSDFTPFVTIIAPCRGVDDGFRENMLALVSQDYPDHEIVFVVDDKDDPATTVIEELRKNFNTKVIVAAKAESCGQKVENLREGILHADARSEGFVFVDSDARPSTDWLRSLVAPLEDTRIGAATGYRWFISNHPTFASELRSVWNASIASSLGPNESSNFCWGGSTAIRREVFDKLDVRKKWRGTLSDDFTLTHALKDAGMPIKFVPQALTASIETCKFRELLEFTTRQMKITRVYASHLWLLSLFGSAVFCGVMITAFLITALNPQNDLPVIVSLLVLAFVTTCSIGKSWLRLKAVKLVLPQYRAELRRQFWTQNTLWLLTPTVFLYNTLAALFSRRLTWRGITYELKSPRETVIIAD